MKSAILVGLLALCAIITDVACSRAVESAAERETETAAIEEAYFEHGGRELRDDDHHAVCPRKCLHEIDELEDEVEGLGKAVRGCATRAVGATCKHDCQCRSGHCVNHKCRKSATGALCRTDNDCVTGHCKLSSNDDVIVDRLTFTCQPGSANYLVDNEDIEPDDCFTNNDCYSGVCDLTNGGHDTDEPGVCRPATAGGPCRNDTDCSTLVCVQALVEGAPGIQGTCARVGANFSPFTRRLQGGHRALQPPPAEPGSCLIDSDCTSNNCDAASNSTDTAGHPICQPNGAGFMCQDNGDCFSENCLLDSNTPFDAHCLPGATGDACFINSDCASGTCTIAGTCS